MNREIDPSHRLDAKELIEIGRTDATIPLVVGNSIFDPLTFDREKIIRFSRKQYLFLNTYRLGIPLDEAARKAEMSIESAERFLKREDTIRWLEDRALMHHIKTEWEEPAKWYEMGDRVLEGKKTLNKSQVEVWKEFGKRIVPLRGEGTGNSTNIQINIDANALERSKARRQIVDVPI